MSVFTVLNIGTGHAKHEKNTLMVRLYDAVHGIDASNVGGGVAQIKMINDGVGKSYDQYSGKISTNYFAQATGWGIGDKSEDTVDEIKRFNPSVVNLVGHSRGAIIAVRTASLLKDALPHARCNLFLVDPVKRSIFASDRYSTTTHRNVALCRQMVMENEGSFMFELTDITQKKGSKAAMNTVRMPGTHGTATQTGQPVGMLAFMLVANFLQLCGTEMVCGTFSAANLCDGYSRVAQANPVKKKGGFFGRVFQDMDSGSKGFKAGSQRHLGKYGSNDFKKDTYFINNDHAAQFRSMWPNIYLALVGKLHPTPSVLPQLVNEARSVQTTAPRAYAMLPDAFKGLTG